MMADETYVAVRADDLHHALVAYSYRIHAVKKTQGSEDPIDAEDVARYARLEKALLSLIG